MSLNKQTVIGRLTRNPEGRDVGQGADAVRVVSFTVASDKETRNATEPDYVNVVAWRQLAQTCEQYLGKGRLVYVEGRPQTRKYDVVKEGVTFTQYITEIVADKVQFLDRAEDGAQGQAPAEQPVTNDTRPPF